MSSDQLSPADLRAVAVARLKRATSLPRMKNGRRPPMHGDAVSEGEKPSTQSPSMEDDTDSSSNPPQPSHSPPSLSSTPQPHETEPPDAVQNPGPTPEPMAVHAQANLPDEEPMEESQDQEQEPTPVSTKRRRRRSRSRSRSRSRDFKDMMTNSRPETPDDASMPPLPFYSPFLGATNPAQLAAFQAHAHAQAQARGYFPTSPLASPFLRSPASPVAPSPLPSLEAIRAGLIRSNSAAARMMAMRKLTGGKESPEPLILSPSPTPPAMTRSNTVTGATGGERMAARRMMLKRLGERTGAGMSAAPATSVNGSMAISEGIPESVREGDELTSGGEEIVIPLARRRVLPQDLGVPLQRWSPRMHSTSNGIVDDREDPGSANPLSHTPSQEPASFPYSPAFSASTLTNHFHHERENGSETAHTAGSDHTEYDGAEVRDGVVIEQPDEPDDISEDVSSARHHQSITPQPSNSFQPASQPTHHRKRVSTRPADLTSTASTMTNSAADDAIPLFFPQAGHASPYERDPFPVTVGPFGTPVKERSTDESEEEAERVVYPEDMKARKAYIGRLESESRLSWADEETNFGRGFAMSPLQLPVTDDIEEDEQHTARFEESEGQMSMDSTSAPPTPSAHPNNLPEALEPEMSPSPETPRSFLSPSPGPEYALQVPEVPSERISQLSEALSITSSSTQAAPTQQDSSTPKESLTEWEDVGTDKDTASITVGGEEKDKSSTKKGLSGWDRVKAPFLSRSVSNAGNGRKSRSNSFNHGAKKDDGASIMTMTTSGNNRESAASGTSGNTATLNAGLQPSGSPHLMQNSPASASMLSLAPGGIPPPRGVSPLPPASAADLAKYADQKLMPFPGLAKLKEEKRQRARGMSVSNEGGQTGTSSSPRVQSPEPVEPMPRMVRQPSETKLLQKAQQQSQAPPPSGAVPSEDARPPSRAQSQRSQFERSHSPTKSISSTVNAGGLPQNREGVKKWLNINLNTKKWLGTGGGNGAGSSSASTMASSMSSRRISDSGTETQDSSRTSVPTVDIRASKELAKTGDRDLTMTPTMELAADPFAGPPPRGASVVTQEDLLKRVDPRTSTSTATESPPLPTPSPGGDASRSPAISRPQSGTSLSVPQSGTSTPPAHDATSARTNAKSAEVLMRLDAILEHAPEDPSRASVLDQPPRKLLLMSKALQVVDRNTVKDRYLFLFTDILVIAKPLDEEPGRESAGSSLDRMFSVKSIVELSKLQFEAPRDETMSLGGSTDYQKHPSVKIFVQRFAKDPDRALLTFLEKTRLKNDPVTIANILFRTIELDKTGLGEYLSRRSSKAILKAFIDRFGFAGVRIDHALRAFLLSVRLPTDSSVLEHMLVNFASRWFEANASIIAFDKDLATRLVFCMMQLNDALHSDINTENTPAGGAFSFPNHHISAQDWLDAFRVLDRRMLVPDDVLRGIYHSIEKEKLAQALDSSVAPIFATISPTTLPSRLTTRVPSETITIKIPEPDPDFGIQLQGQDLAFDPAFLNFTHTSEVSFRIIGNSLGTKTVVFARTGARASHYSGIPLSRTFYVERAFMRNTFRIAFTNHMGMKRKYLFSVDSKADHENWTAAMHRQIMKCKAEPVTYAMGPSSLKIRRAAEAVALQVLRDALIASEEVPSKPGLASALAAHNLTRAMHFPPSPNMAMGGRGVFANGNGVLGAGAVNGAMRGGPKSGHDLLTACQQNSLIPHVLSFLNVVKPV